MKCIIIGIVIFLVCGVTSVSAVERRSCHCGFTSAGNCKPCAGEDAAASEKGCMYGYSETGECLKKDEAIMKQCKCGYGAGKCLPCDESIINKQ